MQLAHSLQRNPRASCTRLAPARPRLVARAGAERARMAPEPADQPAMALRVNYVRKDRAYKGFGLHTWGGATHTEWGRPLAPSGTNPDGSIYWEVPLKPSATWAGVLVHKGDERAAGAEHIELQGETQVWLVGNKQGARREAPDMATVPAGDLNKQHALWLERGTIAWRVPPTDGPGGGGAPRSFALHASADASLRVTPDGVEGASLTIPLTVAAPELPPALTGRWPHLAGCTQLAVPQEHWDKIPELLRGQLALSVCDGAGAALDGTGLQLMGVIDDVFATDEPLGPVWDAARGAWTVAVWAPTATSVQLLQWRAARGGEAGVHDMKRGQRGVWSFEAPADWDRSYYKFKVTAFCPWTNRLETVESTDPYSRGLAANGERSLLVNLGDPDVTPGGWGRHPLPSLGAWSDISVYELHVRDFSATDETVPPPLRGKYRAFSSQHIAAAGGGGAAAGSGSGAPAGGGQQGPSTAGLRHLASLAAAGLTHLHLLPSYDYGSVPERAEEQKRVTEDLSQLPSDSDRQQAAVAAVADEDAFNWGYDPVHYGVPEGSYSTQPDGPLRILEYREMVQGIHALGLRVVADVVYNHTFASGPHARYSVLDKIVPGYYHRRFEDGSMCNSTCCNNTASEHRMMLRLMVDDITHWARDYKVDGFRFDIMGHHMVSHMEAIRTALNALTPEKDGVDGSQVYLYGEAWDFGEVALNARGRNASQLNLGGSKIGAFNDRMRDGAMGGSPFESPDTQGFVTGLYTDPNGAPHQGDAQQQLATLLTRSDWVRYALAGNIRSFEMENYDGRVLPGRKALYHGNQPLAYGVHPCENVVYNGCHDNETIFDQVMMKAPAHAGAAERAQMCRLALALVTLSQGVPFVHAGDDLLRSKSLDRDSYNSGDHFNRVDWSGGDNNFGVGLPPASKNQHSWPLKRPLLAAAAAYKPPPALIAASAAHFAALLRVRYSSPLFRLPATDHINRQITFLNTGPTQTPGVIVIQITSASEAEAAAGGGTFDRDLAAVLLIFNGRPDAYRAAYPGDRASLELHPALAELAAAGDASLADCRAVDGARALAVAPRTAAVFVERRRGGGA